MGTLHSQMSRLTLNIRCIFFALGLGFLLFSCNSPDAPAPVPAPVPTPSPEPAPTPNPEPKTSSYTIEPLQELTLSTEEKGKSYIWRVTPPSGDSDVLSSDEICHFWSYESGFYSIVAEIDTEKGMVKENFEVTVTEKPQDLTPYINKVYEFLPAPGQFVNKLPLYQEGMTAEEMADAAFARIGGTTRGLISLGGFGGYVTFGFDHPIPDREGPDLFIQGNAFDNASEPGIVVVSYDANHNREPDDPWYELVGSEDENPLTIKDYEITYYRPDPQKAPVPDPEDKSITDKNYIKWTDNRGNTGFIQKNSFHSQSYFPEWIKENEITFRGTKLPDNAEVSASSIICLKSFEWGYVDNLPSSNFDGNSFDISNARDAQGEPVDLPAIHFVKVYCGVNIFSKGIGESSTEVLHAYDIHHKKLFD